MRRWLLAVFVLQLFWNIAGFAVMGHLHERQPADRPSVSVSVADVQSIDGKGLIDQAHGLLDELPDLPDSLLDRTPSEATRSLAPAYIAWVQRASPGPYSEALLRPPQPA